jgi:hypothetical protein
MRRMFAVTAMVGAIVCAAATPAAAATIVVSPTVVQTAGTVTVSGDVLVNGVRGCAVGDDVTLSSDAFAGLGEFAGVGAVFVATDASGHFSKTVVLKPSVPAGQYTIAGRCGGANLGVEATLTVTGLPRTGASFGPLSEREAFALGLVLAALGLVLTRVSRLGRRKRVDAGA